MVKKMKTIEETFKAEKEILEEFFKNRQIKKINKISYPFELHYSQQPYIEYKSASYDGDIKNPQELNIKNSFDLIEYLKPCFVYIASDNKAIKEKIIEERANGWGVDENYYFEMGLFLINDSNHVFIYEPVGFNWFYHFKEKFEFDQTLNGDEIKKYIENECRNKNNTFLFNDKPIQFEFIFKINRSDDYMYRLHNDWEAYGAFNLNLNSKPDKKIINAEKTFKEDKCVICLTNPPNILFCNCGYLALCVECSKTGESLENCPICKTENTNLRIIE